MMGHKICYYGDVWLIIPITLSYLEHCWMGQILRMLPFLNSIFITCAQILGNQNEKKTLIFHLEKRKFMVFGLCILRVKKEIYGLWFMHFRVSSSIVYYCFDIWKIKTYSVEIKFLSTCDFSHFHFLYLQVFRNQFLKHFKEIPFQLSFFSSFLNL